MGLKKKVTINGVNTADATAAATDILTGKTAYANGQKLTGTLVQLDTSDATAIAGDIALGKSAYVSGEKIIGTANGASQFATGTMTGGSFNSLPISVNVGFEPKGIVIFPNIDAKITTPTTTAVYYLSMMKTAENAATRSIRYQFVTTTNRYLISSYDGSLNDGDAYIDFTENGFQIKGNLTIVNFLYSSLCWIAYR